MSTSATPAEPHTAWDAGHARAQIRTWAIAIAFALLGRAVIAESRWIPTESMVPALSVGDRLIVEKVTPHFTLPRHGAIVVFRPVWSHDATLLQRYGLADDSALVKRVIGLPGETIAVHDGQVWRNGVVLTEPYAGLTRPDMAPVTVPAAHVFVMGDNRNQSADSRVFGPVPADHLIGRAVWRFWPPGRLGTP
ncbi:MAG: signal peptidase I [Candidatus Sericytochromatia bacterium]|nr:signal peptidase I [Candidatus Sericytochromatia bacterium]